MAHTVCVQALNALNAAAYVAERAWLHEEYLTLLPEMLPFLSELMEDNDGGVEAECQVLLATLEELSGEKPDQYLK